jgi:hypothetical protein
MQFHHAHGFRPQVGDVLRQEWPEAYGAWLDLGAEPIVFDVPGMGPVPGGHRSRRETFERALRSRAFDVPGLSLRQGHVDDVVVRDGRVRGVAVDGALLAADVVVDASGRAGRAVDRHREPMRAGGLCGMAYVDRQYRLHPGAEPGPMVNPLAWQGDFPGYQSIVFLHERGYFSVLLVRPTADDDLKVLRHDAAFDAAARAIPGLSAWTDPDRAQPVTGVLAGGALRNAYRGQRGPGGARLPRGLLSLGDAVATTTPTFGRGLALTSLQVRALLGLLDGGADLLDVAEPFDAWCEDNMLPWVLDHVLMDGELVRRWQGADVDLTRRLPSDLVLTAMSQEPRIAQAAGGYVAMTALPAVLDAVEPLARAVFEGGWRPAYSPGPTRDELLALVGGAVAA